jgi:hypothetical protein
MVVERMEGRLTYKEPERERSGILHEKADHSVLRKSDQGSLFLQSLHNVLFLWYWGFNSGPCTFQAGIVLLETLHHSSPAIMSKTCHG